jgi:uncharacterized membrane protein
MSQVKTQKTAEIQKGDESLRATVTHTQAYPEPSILAEYEKVKEGFADRLIKMAEKEQDARILREDRKISLFHKRENTTRWGLVIGLLAVLPIYGISIYTISIGEATIGASILIGSTIANLAGVFVIRKTGLFDDKKEE